mgnify:CR=1 FL=1
MRKLSQLHPALRPALVLVLCLVLHASSWAESAADFNTRGVDHYNKGSFQEALSEFEQAYALAPTHNIIQRNLCNAHQGLANELAKAGDFSQAIKQLEAATTIDPENDSPLVQMGSYFLRQNMLKNAIERLEAAISINPKNIEGHELLGEAYYRDNDIPSARIQWEWVLDVKPDHPNLKERLAKAIREEGVEADHRPTGSRHFQLSVPPELPSPMLRQMLSILENAYADIGRHFGRVYPADKVQVIVYTGTSFADATLAGEHVGALYDGKIRIPVNDSSSGQFLSEPELRQRLYHEYTHVIVRQICGDRIPWWLNEGMAETFSHDVEPVEIEILQKAHQEDLLFPLSKLEAEQLNVLGPESLRIAYAQVHATVHVLWSRFGQARLGRMVTDLAEGAKPESALREHYNRTYSSLQKEVIKTLGLTE